MEIYIKNARDWEWVCLGLLRSPKCLLLITTTHGSITVQIILNPFLSSIHGRHLFLFFVTNPMHPYFLNYLGRQHSSINYNMETEENCSLSFLDVIIKKNENKFSTSIFRKHDPVLEQVILVFACIDSKLTV